ncbi:uncharacterized protein LOC117166866 [Belonocnema kinseyi]|uniref:uncharacterized protein LOC117166866 n=1 Tax=Belonocnema kinseyi TaxID=2817044 RepID=UPI00143CFA28|nr:uncharacterized protein LOC117166866 [Belonocnema kinseyi]XP_033207138.1 uncharacterized protein LOC117166866 [Belonocnema kinseyi]
MDYEYDGVLKELYCELCAEHIPDVHLAYDHKCFEIFQIDSLTIVGNVIMEKNILSDEMAYVDDISVEYLDEFERPATSNLSTKISALARKDETIQLAKISNSKISNSGKKGATIKEMITISPMSRLHAQTRKVIEFCNKDYAEMSVASSTEFSQAGSSIHADAINDQDDIDLDENGVAYASAKNLIKLIELDRERSHVFGTLLCPYDKEISIQ